MKRLFHFQDGKSNKFWEIELSGNSFTVRFGKIGTNGQTQTKEFDDDVKTEKEYDKLVAEKRKKGYVEQGGTALAAPTATASAPAAPKKEAPKKKALVQSKPAVENAPVSESEIVHKLILDPTDWFWATWRDLEPLALPKFEKYNPKKMEEKALKARKKVSNWYNYPAEYAFQERGPLSPGEAKFWLESILLRNASKKQYVSESGDVEPFTKEEARKKYIALESVIRQDKGTVIQIMRPLVAPIDLLDIILDEGSREDYESSRSKAIGEIAESFGIYVRPYLSREEYVQLKNQMRDRFGEAASLHIQKNIVSVHHLLAAILGLHEEITDIVAGLDTPNYAASPETCVVRTPLVFGLGSPDRIKAEWRRLRLRMRTPLDVRKWLANTELTGLDEIAHSANAARTNRYTETSIPKELAQTLSNCVLAPEAAPTMIALKRRMQGGNPKAAWAADRRSQGTSPAEHWLVKNPELAIAGLIETATQDTEVGKDSLAFLKIKSREGFKQTIEKYLSHHKQDVVDFLNEHLFAAEADAPPVLDETNVPQPIQKALAETKTKGIVPPLWAGFAAMPPILVDGAVVSGNLYKKMIGAVDKSKFDEPAPLISALREAANRKSLEDWSFALFDAWVKEAFPPDAKWALKSLGYFGGEYYKYTYDENNDRYPWRNTERLNWFGPTKAKISLVWLIGSGKNEKKKQIEL